MKTIQHAPDKRAVIIEVADVFLAQQEFEEIPDPLLQPKESRRWNRTERNAVERLIAEQLDKARAEGYTRSAVRDWHYCNKKGISLGLNGMFLLLFAKGAKP